MNKTKNPAGFQPRVAPAQPLTEEEKKIKIAQFLQQKRETIAVNVLCNLCQGWSTIMFSTNYQGKDLVDTAVEMADHLMEKLYPIKEESK